VALDEAVQLGEHAVEELRLMINSNLDI